MAKTPDVTKSVRMLQCSSEPNLHFTPCRQVGLKRKSLVKNDDVHTPVSSKATSTTSSAKRSAKLIPVMRGKRLKIDDFNEEQKTKSENKVPLHCDSSNMSDTAKHIQQCEDMLDSILSPHEVALLWTLVEHNTTENQKKCDLSPINGEDLNEKIKEIEYRLDVKRGICERLGSNTKNVVKHDLNNLKNLSERWKNAGQQALHELLHIYNNNGENCTMPMLLDVFGIPDAIFKYSEDEQDFVE